MQLEGSFFPGMRDQREAISQRSYSYDPIDSRSRQSSQAEELMLPTADNITQLTIFGPRSVKPPVWPESGLLGNLVRMFKGAFFSQPDWWDFTGAHGPGGWDGVRAQVQVYVPHLPAQPIPVWKLYEPGSGFILPATFLGQPLAPAVRPIGG